MIGIYTIRNIQDNKRYIGQSVNIEKRFITHRSSLNKGSHFNKHLQYAWNKYGKEQFVFEVVEICEKCSLNDKETYWKDYYDPQTYNLGHTGNVGTVSQETRDKVSVSINKLINSMSDEERKLKYGHNKNVGKKRSEEVKLRISNTLRGKPSYIRSNETLRKQSLHNTFRRNIFQFNKEGKFLRAWPSITSCIRNNTELDQGAISACCKGTRISTKGYRFQYASDREIQLLELGYIPHIK